MVNEKLIEKNLVKGVEKLGGWAVKFWPISISGFPDRMVLMPGAKIYFVELKSTGHKPTPIQRNVMRKLIKLGFSGYVIDCKELLTDFLNDIAG